jgi:hypothetical protein
MLVTDLEELRLPHRLGEVEAARAHALGADLAWRKAPYVSHSLSYSPPYNPPHNKQRCGASDRAGAKVRRGRQGKAELRLPHRLGIATIQYLQC